MRISASITNRMVRNNSLPDRPMRGFRAGRGADDATGSLVGSVPGSNMASAEDSEPSYDAPHPRARQTWREIVDGRAFADFRQRRIGQHDAGEVADIQASRDRQSPHRDQFSGLRTDDAGAYDLTLPVGDDFNVAVRLALGLSAVVVVIGPAQNTNLELARARLGLGQSGLRELRLGVGHPWDNVIVHFDRQTEQRIPDHQAGVII